MTEQGKAMSWNTPVEWSLGISSLRMQLTFFLSGIWLWPGTIVECFKLQNVNNWSFMRHFQTCVLCKSNQKASACHTSQGCIRKTTFPLKLFLLIFFFFFWFFLFCLLLFIDRFPHNLLYSALTKLKLVGPECGRVYVCLPVYIQWVRALNFSVRHTYSDCSYCPHRYRGYIGWWHLGVCSKMLPHGCAVFLPLSYGPMGHFGPRLK